MSNTPEPEINITHLGDGNTHVLVNADSADSLYEAITKTGLSAAKPKGAVWSHVRYIRREDGRIERVERLRDCTIEVSDPNERVGAVVTEWLKVLR